MRGNGTGSHKDVGESQLQPTRFVEGPSATPRQEPQSNVSVRFWPAQASLICLGVLLTASAGYITAAALAQSNAGTSSNQHHKASKAAINPHDQPADAYAIYSLLMPGRVFSDLGPSQNQQWAIADLTIRADDMNPALAPNAFLQPPRQNARAFHEAVQDYNVRKNDEFKLTRNFQLDRPYTLLNPSAVADFRASRTSLSAPSSLQDRYKKYPGITSFSPVFFNANHDAALVYIHDWCGNLCMEAEWVYLEKQNGQWIRRSGKTS